ncbi:uncharacterized protein [Amphiura filiformis]|uniref:uncharacterized protein isoform X3 n=1 Tax=Amphiura filiformis TaxID=82378 RepID=UPI003B212D45
MSSIKQKEKDKKMQEKYQSVLARLLREEDNKYCIDCDAKGPRWASWNLGIFLCIRCAGIHRNLGVHISRVKSVNLDSWTEEQIHSMEDTGNTVGRRLYEGNLPEGYRRPQTDSSALEHFIRAKYEHKKYINKNYVKPPVRHTEFEEPEKERRRKPKAGKSSTVSLQKPKESSSNSSSAKATSSTTSSSTAAAASLVSTPVTTAAVARPEAAKATLTVQQSPPQKSVSLPTTPVSRRKAVDDLLGLDTPPSNQDLLGMNTPQHPAGQSSSSNNIATNSAMEMSLFGDEAEIQQPDQSSKKNKDSIMALYGSGSQKQPAYGVPGGMYIPAQGQQPQQQAPQQQYSVANGYPNGGMPGMQHAATVPGMQPAVSAPGMQQQGGMMGNQGIRGNQPGMMGRQQGMMGMPGMYNTQAQQQQQAYLSQPTNQQQHQSAGGPQQQTQPQMGLQGQQTQPQMGLQGQQTQPQMGLQGQQTQAQIGLQSQQTQPQMGLQSQQTQPQMGLQGQQAQLQMGIQGQQTQPQMGLQGQQQTLPQMGLQGQQQQPQSFHMMQMQQQYQQQQQQQMQQWQQMQYMQQQQQQYQQQQHQVITNMAIQQQMKSLQVGHTGITQPMSRISSCPGNLMQMPMQQQAAAAGVPVAGGNSAGGGGGGMGWGMSGGSGQTLSTNLWK